MPGTNAVSAKDFLPALGRSALLIVDIQERLLAAMP
jgi:hypothetical protein